MGQEDRVADSLGAVGWRLSAEQLSRLDEVSARPRPYPFNLMEYFRPQFQ